MNKAGEEKDLLLHGMYDIKLAFFGELRFLEELSSHFWDCRIRKSSIALLKPRVIINFSDCIHKPYSEYHNLHTLFPCTHLPAIEIGRKIPRWSSIKYLHVVRLWESIDSAQVLLGFAHFF